VKNVVLREDEVAEVDIEETVLEVGIEVDQVEDIDDLHDQIPMATVQMTVVDIEEIAPEEIQQHLQIMTALVAMMHHVVIVHHVVKEVDMIVHHVQIDQMHHVHHDAKVDIDRIVSLQNESSIKRRSDTFFL
jgi:hypothetical protein